MSPPGGGGVLNIRAVQRRYAGLRSIPIRRQPRKILYFDITIFSDDGDDNNDDDNDDDDNDDDDKDDDDNDDDADDDVDDDFNR